MSNEIDDSLEEFLQHGMAVSAQAGRELSRAWREHLRRLQQQPNQATDAARQAFDGERALAREALAPVENSEWWEKASPREICEAYEKATAWAEHDPAAATAERTIREQAAQRYGIDPERLLEEGHRHTDRIMGTSPEKLAAAQQWARENNWKNDIPSYYPEAQKLHNLLTDYDRATEAARAKAERHENAALESLGEAGRDLEEAEQRTEDLRQAPAEEQEHVKEQVAAAEKSADNNSLDASAEINAAGVAYNDKNRLQSEAEKMRAAGVPERAIEAKQFGQSQQKFAPAHAAAGSGKSVGKVKTYKVQQSKQQGQRLAR